MAYCKSCGAYIPDGQTKCLACGYDEAAKPEPEQTKNASAAAASATTGEYHNSFSYRDGHEDLRQRLEEQRRAQQEAQRRLAEQEYARRKKQEEDRQWAQQEYERRQEEKRRQEHRQEQENARTYAQDAARYTYRSQAGAQPNKMLAALSYLGVLCILPYLFADNDSFAKFHAGQGVRLLIFSAVGTVLTSIIGLGWLFTLASLYFIYKGMSSALNGRMDPLPWIGTIGGK